MGAERYSGFWKTGAMVDFADVDTLAGGPARYVIRPPPGRGVPVQAGLRGPVQIPQPGVPRPGGGSAPPPRASRPGTTPATAGGALPAGPAPAMKLKSSPRRDPPVPD